MQIKDLVEMAQDVVDYLPTGYTVDGNQRLFCDGRPASIMELLSSVEKTRRYADKLKDAIQAMSSNPPTK